MEYYAAEKNNDIMKFAGKWRELENVILSEEQWIREIIIIILLNFDNNENLSTMEKKKRDARAWSSFQCFQCFRLASANTYSIYKLQKHKEEPVWQNQIQDCVITTDAKKLKYVCDQRSVSSGLVFMVLQRPEARSQTNDSWR
ncbi:hypothetical protein STEG23_013686 [Scotinomys teguina]